jgi:hypothetical protein
LNSNEAELIRLREPNHFRPVAIASTDIIAKLPIGEQIAAAPQPQSAARALARLRLPIGPK